MFSYLVNNNVVMGHSWPVCGKGKGCAEGYEGPKTVGSQTHVNKNT